VGRSGGEKKTSRRRLAELSPPERRVEEAGCTRMDAGELDARQKCKTESGRREKERERKRETD